MRVLFFLMISWCAVSAGAWADMPAKKRIPLPPLEFGPADFGNIRGFVWGVNPKDVRRFEQATFFDEVEQEDGHLAFFYLDRVLGGRTLLNYRFYKDQLWQARFDFKKSFERPRHAIDDFMKVQSEIEKKYGPAQLDMTWVNETHKDYPDDWGIAVLTEDLKIKALWEAPDTNIVMTLSADEFEFQWQATFTSTTISAQIEKDGQGGAAAILPQTRRTEALP